MTKLQHRRSSFSRPHAFLHQPRAFFSRHRIASMIAGQVVVITVLAVFALNSVFGFHLFSAFAQMSCPAGDTIYTIQPGDTLGNIATTHGTSWQTVAQHNQIGDPNRIYANQQICIPGHGTRPTGLGPLHNTANPFPYGQCTWWAAQRYHDLHGYYVAWSTNANAWQWTARAYDYHWKVSNQPSYGAIIDFQPDVQGASNLGHVGVVEKILSNGNVVTSNMNVTNHPFGTVVNLTFHAGPGVTFISV